MNLYNIRQQLNMGVSLNTIPLRVTDYSRVSTDHIEQQTSLRNQIDHFDEMIKSNKNWTYVKGYIDNGISGTTDYKRTNFMKMIDDARCGKFDLIVTKEISRFSRNTLDSIKYTRELLSWGVAVLFVNDNINTALPDSELRLTIMASMAQDEIRRLSERVKFGMKRSIKNGTILGNNMMYGYKKDKQTGNLIIVEYEANIIRRIFRLYAIDNWSINKIVKYLNHENTKTRQNKNWCVSTITRMIKNPKYKGYYCGGKTEIIDYMTKKVRIIPDNNWVLYEDKLKVPPIIKKELWERANERLKKNKNDKKPYQNRYPLSAKIYCKNHNDVFHRRIQCKSNNDITWVCAKHLKEGKNTCNSPNIRESEVYAIINDVMENLGINPSNITNILMALYESNKNDYNINTKISELNKQRNKLLLKKDKILELNIDGCISNIEFNNRNKEYNKELDFLNKNILLLEQSKINSNNLNDEKETILNSLKQKTKDINNKLIELLVNKIVVSKSDSKDKINFDIFFNLSKAFIINETKCILEDNKFMPKKYKFKRGYNTTSTRRYVVEYQVSSYIGK